MTALLYLIEQIAPGLYLLLAAGIFLSWRSWMGARYAFRATAFELERDLYRYRQSNALTGLVVLVQLALIVFGIQNVVVPTIRSTSGAAPAVAQVVTDGIVSSPTPAPITPGRQVIDASGVQIGQQEEERIIATPTLTPTPVGTINPNAPPAAGCDTPNAFLQVPANGMIVFDPLVMRGTAFVDNFAFYRFEISGPTTRGSFALLGEYTRPVLNLGELGQFVPSLFEPGEYKLRLTVFDITTALKAACEINITVIIPLPTATPLAQR